MKILSLIIALYILVLSIKPCCAVDNCADKDHSTKTEQASNHQNDNDCKDGCSPFFNCGSCTGFSFPTLSPSLTSPAIALTAQVSIYHSSFSSEFLSSIWQPPKIS